MLALAFLHAIFLHNDDHLFVEFTHLTHSLHQPSALCTIREVYNIIALAYKQYTTQASELHFCIFGQEMSLTTDKFTFNCHPVADDVIRRFELCNDHVTAVFGAQL